MTDEAKLRKQQDRGERAQRVLENELVQEAFDEIEKTIMQAWKDSPADAEKERYNAYLMYRLFNNFRSHFDHIVRTGEAANNELLQIKDPSKLRRMING